MATITNRGPFHWKAVSPPWVSGHKQTFGQNADANLGGQMESEEWIEGIRSGPKSNRIP
jgi:hypothetical protein